MKGRQPVNKTMSVSCGRWDALRTALWILWMLVRHPRSTVTFEIGEDS